MKRVLFIILFFSFASFLFPEEIDLNADNVNKETFVLLSIEDQYASYINSFSELMDPMMKPNNWAWIMVLQQGRDLLPYIDETLSSINFSNKYHKPYDSTLDCLYFLFSSLMQQQLLSEYERQQYMNIVISKIGEMLLEYPVIDGSIRITTSLYYVLEPLDSNLNDWEDWLFYFEDKLGIDITMGNLNQQWEDIKPGFAPWQKNAWKTQE